MDPDPGGPKTCGSGSATLPVAAVVGEEGEQCVRAHTLGGGHGRQLLGLEVHLGVAQPARLLGARLEGNRGQLVPAIK